MHRARPKHPARKARPKHAKPAPAKRVTVKPAPVRTRPAVHVKPKPTPKPLTVKPAPPAPAALPARTAVSSGHHGHSRAIDLILVALLCCAGAALAVAVLLRGTNSAKNAWYYNRNATVVALKIDGKKVTRSNEVEVRGLPEGVAFSDDGQYIYVGNYLDRDLSILKVEGDQKCDHCVGPPPGLMRHMRLVKVLTF